MPKAITGLLVRCADCYARGTSKETKRKGARSSRLAYFMVPLGTPVRQAIMVPRKRGRPPTGKGTQVQVRLQPKQLAKLDAWIKRQPKPKPSRPEAIRQLIEKQLS
jgi:hypothetical protein